jgi:hypothetical protein
LRLSVEVNQVKVEEWEAESPDLQMGGVAYEKVSQEKTALH